MKRIILYLLIMTFTAILANSQIPQFAVARPDGTTYICPTWDSAYNKAQNDDFIYLPGTTINQEITINKKLFIYGAGHNPDSSIATGRTTINGTIFIASGATGGIIEGINAPSNSLLFVYNNKKINGFSIKRCRIGSVSLNYLSTPPNDSFPTNIFITESVISNIDGASEKAVGNLFSKNILNTLSNMKSCIIKNNIFISCCPLYSNISLCTFENNIFNTTEVSWPGYICNNNFYNNLKLAGYPLLNSCSGGPGFEVGTIYVSSIADVFISFNPSLNNPYIDNYHLKPTCPGVNAGTDGTDVGIYGTSQPTNQGWVPSNPHIYFKQVADQTNSSGQLQIQFKVRTGN